MCILVRSGFKTACGFKVHCNRNAHDLLADLGVSIAFVVRLQIVSGDELHAARTVMHFEQRTGARAYSQHERTISLLIAATSLLLLQGA
jgi:hypothetical protein